jgi:hypothetical protein
MGVFFWLGSFFEHGFALNVVSLATIALSGYVSATEE